MKPIQETSGYYQLIALTVLYTKWYMRQPGAPTQFERYKENSLNSFRRLWPQIEKETGL